MREFAVTLGIYLSRWAYLCENSTQTKRQERMGKKSSRATFLELSCNVIVWEEYTPILLFKTYCSSLLSGSHITGTDIFILKICLFTAKFIRPAHLLHSQSV